MKYILTALLVYLHGTILFGAEPIFDPQEFRVAVGTDSATVFVTTDAKAANGADKLILTAINDLGPVGGGNDTANLIVTFSPPVEVSRAGTRATWKSILTVKEMPRASSLNRLAQFVFSDQSAQAARYSLTTRASNFNWSVTTGTKRVVCPPNKSFELTVSTTGGTGTRVRIDNNSLQETSTGCHVDPDWLHLSASSGDGPEVVPEGTRKTLVVELSDAIPNGTYLGSINLALDESADAKGVEITLYRSSTSSRWAGVGLIFLGVMFAFFGNTVAKNVSAAADALMPATQLRALGTARLQKILDCSPVLAKKVPQTLAALDEINKALSPSQLRAMRFVPPWFASPFGVTQTAPAAYASFLQDMSNRLASLGFLINHGLCPAALIKFDAQNRAQANARDQALTQLDNLAMDPSKGIPQLAQDIPPILAAYHLALNPPPPGVAAIGAPPPSITDRPSMETLSFRLNLATGGAWALALLATVVTGYGVLIASNLGFGIELDFVKCFLWGLGVQIMGQQFSQLTPGSVSTTLGFKAPSV
jgi:hypothetical protein